MHRFRIVVALAGMLALVAFTLAATILVRHGGAAPSLGWTDAALESGWMIDGVDPAGPAAGILRVGDRLLSLDGDTLVAHFGAGYYRTTQPIGSTYTLRVGRDGRASEHTLTVGAGRRTFGSDLPLLLASAVWCLVGLFIGWARPDDAVARLAFASSVGTAIVFVQMDFLSGMVPGTLYQPLHMVVGYHFFYRFPGGIRRGRSWRGLLWLFYTLGIVSCALRQPLNWVYLTEGAGAATAWAAQHPEQIRLSLVLAVSIMFPLIAASVALIGSTYRALEDEDKRRRIRWVVYSSVVGLSPQLVWAAVNVGDAFGSPAPSTTKLVVNLMTTGASALIPIGVAYAVVRHRVFDIAVVVRRGVQYLLARRSLQFLMALPATLVVLTVVTHRDNTIGELLAENAAYLWLMGGTAFSLRFRRPMLRSLDRRFFREQYDREQVLVDLLDDLGHLTEADDVVRLVCAQVDQALHPTSARLWFEGDPDPPAESLLAAVEGDRAGPDRPLTSGPDLPDGISLAVPLLGSDERLTGVLMLGEKRSEEPYSANDLALLGFVAKQASMARENLVLRGRISEEQRIRHDVLAHLEPDRVNLMKECPACGSCYDSTEERCEHDGNELGLSLPVTRTVAGRYRIDALIRRGGMGAVYEAIDTRLHRTVAVKFVLSNALNQEHALRRFRREARAVARIHHPNVVSVHDYGRLDAPGAYLVMERVRGVTMREELSRHGPLSGAAAAAWFGPLLDGVAAAHEEGVVHRDLKPENVVRHRPEYGPPVVKILDFGIAKVRPVDTVSDHLTGTGMMVGTRGYMSPEQLTGADVDARSDIFAVGVMVVEALTGRWPFQGGTYDELLTSILLKPYHLPGGPPPVPALDALLQRCLAKEPRDRFASAEDLREHLLPVLRECPALGPESAEA